MYSVMSEQRKRVFVLACEAMKENRRFTRKHEELCHPCGHDFGRPEMTDKFLWSKWNSDLREFCYWLIFQIREILRFPDMSETIGPHTPETIEYEALVRIWDETKQDFALDVMPWCDESGIPETMIFHEELVFDESLGVKALAVVEGNFYEYTDTMTCMKRFEQRPTGRDAMKTVVFAFGILGWHNWTADPEAIIQESRRPVLQKKSSKVVKVYTLLPQFFLEGVVHRILQEIETNFGEDAYLCE